MTANSFGNFLTTGRDISTELSTATVPSWTQSQDLTTSNSLPLSSSSNSSSALNLPANSSNSAPRALQFELNQTSLSPSSTLGINSAWVFDGNGASDIARVDFRLRRSDGVLIDLNDAVNFTPWASDSRWGSFGYSVNLNNLSLNGGNYSLWAQAIDRSGAASMVVEKAFTIASSNLVPEVQFSLNKTSVTSTETLSVSNAWAYDGNGFRDIRRVDFKLKLSDNTFIDVADATSFTPWAVDARWAGFNYNLNLSSLNLNNGNYTLWAQTIDASGAVSAAYEQAFTVIGTNLAPNSLQFNLDQTTLNRTDTLSVNNAWVFDGNGARDIARIDFKLKLSDNTFIDVADATNFTAWSQTSGWAGFNYNLNLSSLNLNGGNYTLWAQGIDSSGAVTASYERAFTITGTNFVPNTLQFNLDSTNLTTTSTVRINGGWVYDENGFGDLSRIDFKLRRSDGTFIDVPDAVSFTPWVTDSRWAGFSYNLNLGSLNLRAGDYTLWAQAIDRSGSVSTAIGRTFSLSNNVDFLIS